MLYYGSNWLSVISNGSAGENTVCIGAPVGNSNGDIGVQYFVNSAFPSQNVISQGSIFPNPSALNSPNQFDSLSNIYTSQPNKNSNAVVVGYISASSKYTGLPGFSAPSNSNNSNQVSSTGVSLGKYIYATINGPNLLISTDNGGTFTIYPSLPKNSNVPITIQTDYISQSVIIAYATDPTSTWISTTYGNIFNKVAKITNGVNTPLQFGNTPPISAMNGYGGVATCSTSSKDSTKSQIYIGSADQELVSLASQTQDNKLIIASWTSISLPYSSIGMGVFACSSDNGVWLYNLPNSI
jgi:hypothetical protein